MIIGVPKEIKTDEWRVGTLPVGAELPARFLLPRGLCSVSMPLGNRRG